MFLRERMAQTTVFHDRKEVCFVTNVFPEQMDSKVARVQPDGVLRYQSRQKIQALYWLRLFFQFLNYAINNAYLLYKHSCKRYGVKPMDLLAFVYSWYSANHSEET